MIKLNYKKYQKKDIQLKGNWKVVNRIDYSMLFDGNKTINDYFTRIIVFPHLDCFVVMGSLNNYNYTYFWNGETYVCKYKSNRYILFSYDFDFILQYSDGVYNVYNYTISGTGLYQSDIVFKAQDLIFKNKHVVFINYDNNNILYYDIKAKSFFKTFLREKTFDNKKYHIRYDHKRHVEIYDKKYIVKKQKNLINNNATRKMHLLYKGQIYKKIGNIFIIKLDTGVVIFNVANGDILFRGKSIQQFTSNEIAIIDIEKIAKIYDDYMYIYNNKHDSINEINYKKVKLKRS